MNTSSNNSGIAENNSHIKMGYIEKIMLRLQIIYFTISRYWYRWSRYITFRTTCMLICLFLSYFYMTGALSSTAHQVTNYIQSHLQQEDILEAQMIIYKLRMEQEKYEQALKNVQEYMSNMAEQVETLKTAFKDANGTAIATTVEDVIKSETLAQIEANIKNLELRFEKVQNNFNEVTETKNDMCTTPAPTIFQPVLHNLASKQNGAWVIPELSSRPIIETTSYYHHIYNLFYDQNTYQWPVTDRSIMLSGDAYCFKGEDGYLTINLSTAAKISKVVYEHFYWINDVPISAPTKYIVEGCLDMDCEQIEELGECLYLQHAYKNAQECDVITTSRPVRRIRLHFLKNHGQTYTCIYNVKIY